MSTSALEQFLARAERLMAHFEATLPPAPPPTDFARCTAFRWKRQGATGHLLGIQTVQPMRLSDLQGIDDQKERLVANTRQFLAGKPANNALLTGSRGSGKSSIVRALLNEYAERGLRVIEVDKNDLVDLPDIVEQVRGRPERFIVFCDDLSFDSGETTYKALKVVLDGSLAAPPDNVLIYATSNRRHLMPEFFSENLEGNKVGEEIHPGEAIEEKISLSDRFGLWLSFYPFDQEHYLEIARHWLAHFGVPQSLIDECEREALNWALGRGSRSGRVAWQFAKDFAARHARSARRKKAARS